MPYLAPGLKSLKNIINPKSNPRNDWKSKKHSQRSSKWSNKIMNFSDQFFFPDLNSIAKYRQHDFNSWNLDFSVKSRSWNCRIKNQCFLGFAAIFQIVLESQICTSKGLFIGLQIFIKAHWFFLIIRNP